MYEINYKKEIHRIQVIIDSLKALGFSERTVMGLREVSSPLERIKGEIMRQVMVYCHNSNQSCGDCFVNKSLNIGLSPRSCNAYKNLEAFLVTK